MKKILFPTAYSGLSKRAFRYTQKLAQYFKASITLVHIYEPPSSVIGPDQEQMYDAGEFNIMETDKVQWKEEIRKLKEFATESSAKQFHDIALHFIAVEGNVIDELKEIQAEDDFDLVVMGMRRHSMVGRLLGNTTYEMIEQMDCPILMIPPSAQFIHIEKIVYGTAFEFGNRKAITHLLEWGQAFGASLHTLHLHKDYNKKEASEQMEKLRYEFREEEKLDLMTFQIKEGKIKDIMDWYSVFQGSVILAVHWRKQGFLQELMEGNLTKTLVEKTQAPLLVLKS